MTMSKQFQRDLERNGWQQGIELPNLNTSGLFPKGHCILLSPYEPQRKGSRLILPDSVSQRADYGVVIAIGSACWCDEPEPRAQIGDRVMVPYLAGRIVTGPKDGKAYRAVNDKDIFMQVMDEE